MNLNLPNRKASLQTGGILHFKATMPMSEAHKAIIKGVFVNPNGRTDEGYLMHDTGDGMVTFEGYLHNAFVNQGLQGALDSMYGDLVADRITHIGVSGDQTTVTGATTTLGTPNSIKTTSNTSRTGQTVSTQQTWTQADVNFPIYKIGLLRGSSPTDVSNIIGGTGGAAPYNEPFTIDLTNIATWSLTMGIDVTMTAS